jgi:hypothetical protein
MTQMTDAQMEELRAAQLAVFTTLLQTFGAAWADDPRPPSNSPEEIARLRAALAVPMTAGALAAVMAFVWVTAPPGGTLEQLGAHMKANVDRFLAERDFESLGEAGSFWTGPEMMKAMAEAADG